MVAVWMFQKWDSVLSYFWEIFEIKNKKKLFSNWVKSIPVFTSAVTFSTSSFLISHFIGKQHKISRPEVFCGKYGFKNFAKFRGKQFCKNTRVTGAVFRRCSVKKVFLKILKKFIGKHLCHSLCAISFMPATQLEKRLWHKCFPVNFAKFWRTPFFTEQSLLTKIQFD